MNDVKKPQVYKAQQRCKPNTRCKCLAGVGFTVALIVVLIIVLYGECEGKRVDGDYVSLVFADCPSDARVTAFTSAATRLSAAVGQTSNVVGTFAEVRVRDVCGLVFLDSTNPVMFERGLVENMVIVASVRDIDGEGGVLAQAGPCSINPDTGLPFAGVMIFDSADVAGMEEENTLEDVILHEMLHVLGLGTLWDISLGEYDDIVLERDILEDEVFQDFLGVVVGVPENEPKYIGTAGAAAYSVLTGETEAFVPVQGAVTPTQVFNVAAGEGQGSVDGHWDKAEFQTELMTFSISPEDESHPLSAMSLGSLRDLGYDVNLSVADEYSLGSNSADVVEFESLRGKDKPKRTFDMSNDILRITPRVVNLN